MICKIDLYGSVQGAIMAVGASKPTVVVDKDGFFSIKNEMLVSLFSYYFFVCVEAVVIATCLVFYAFFAL
jgi:hypothetical protein